MRNRGINWITRGELQILYYGIRCIHKHTVVHLVVPRKRQNTICLYALTRRSFRSDSSQRDSLLSPDPVVFALKRLIEL